MRISEVFAMGGGPSVPGYDCHKDDCSYGYYPYFNGYDYHRDYGRYPYYYNGYNHGGYAYAGKYRFLGIF